MSLNRRIGLRLALTGWYISKEEDKFETSINGITCL